MDDWEWDTMKDEEKRAYILFTVFEKKPSTIKAESLIEFTDALFTYIKTGGKLADIVPIKSVKK